LPNIAVWLVAGLKRCRQTWCSYWSSQVVKFGTDYWHLVTSLTGISDLLQGCPNNSDTVTRLWQTTQGCNNIGTSGLLV
jgi:hypothetical protein